MFKFLAVQFAKRHGARVIASACGMKDYPAAGVYLDGLTSEIRLRTLNLPLAVCPTALRDAARLLDEKKPKELLAPAKNELERAKELGYAGKDAVCASLNKSISDLEKQRECNSDTGLASSQIG